MPASLNGRRLTAVMRDGKRLCPAFQSGQCPGERVCGFAHLCACVRLTGRACGGKHAAGVCRAAREAVLRAAGLPTTFASGGWTGHGRGQGASPRRRCAIHTRGSFSQREVWTTHEVSHQRWLATRQRYRSGPRGCSRHIILRAPSGACPGWTRLHRAHASPHNLLASLTRLSPSPFFKPLNLWRNTTSRGFEPLQAEPNEFQVYLLSRSGCRAATILALAQMLQGLRSLVRDTVSERLRRWTRNPLGSARRGSNPLGVACCARARGLRRKPMQVRPPGIEPGTI